MTKAKTRTRIVYRDRPAKHYLSLDTIKRIKDWFYVVVPVVAALWIVAGPYVDAKAAEYLKAQLTLIGMNPENIEALNKNIVELQAKVVEKDNAVKNLSDEVLRMQGDIGKVLILLQTQPQQVPVTQPVK